MTWNSNIFTDYTPELTIYGLSYKMHYIYIGIYNGDFQQFERLLDLYREVPEQFNKLIQSSLTENECYASSVNIFFTNKNFSLNSFEPYMNYNGFMWAYYILLLEHQPKYNSIENFDFGQAHYISLLETKDDGQYNSNGEKRVAEWLKKHSIPYEREYSYPDLQGDYAPLRFDFKIIGRPIVIEFQGKQHYVPTDFFGNMNFQRQQRYDEKKRQYCEKNKIRLIEIPYTCENLNEYLNEIL